MGEFIPRLSYFYLLSFSLGLPGLHEVLRSGGGELPFYGGGLEKGDSGSELSKLPDDQALALKQAGPSPSTFGQVHPRPFPLTCAAP